MHKFFVSFSILTILLLSAFLSFVFLQFDDKALEYLSFEGGFIEVATAVMFALTAFFALLIYWQKRHRLWLYFGLLMTLACMREMELHRAWTSDSILKSNFYLNADSIRLEVIAGLAVIILLLFLTYQMIRRVPQWLAALWRFKVEAWALGFALGFLTLAKTLDSMKRWFPSLTDFKDDNRAFLDVVEESFELTAVLFLFFICVMALARKC